MKLHIKHLTRHRYTGPVSFSAHSLFLRPLEGHLRRVHRFTVNTIPPSSQNFVRDVDGNTVLKCNFGLTESNILEFLTEIEVEINEDNPYDFLLESYALGYPFTYVGADVKALQPYLFDVASEEENQVLDWFNKAVPSPAKHPDIVAFLTDLNHAIRRDITYVRRDEEGIQTPDTTLALRSGACRDMAALFISTVRKLGLAARFVSGYLFVIPREDTDDQTYNRAAGSMHAWAEVYLPGAGWKGFDPTNGILANSFFISTAVSHSPEVVDPIQGNYFSKQATDSVLEVQLDLEEIGVDTFKGNYRR